MHTVLVITERLCHEAEIQSTYVYERPLIAIDGLPVGSGAEPELPNTEKRLPHCLLRGWAAYEAMGGR